MEQDLTRIGVSLPENLLEKFDEKIMTLRGVKHVKLTTIIPGEEI